jgi:Protein of unknown function (DUF3106)
MRRLLLMIGLASFISGSHALAQTNQPLKTAIPANVSSASLPTLSQPLWKDLSAAEQASLSPLAASWDQMSEDRKRKWQTVAKDFDKLPPEQRSKMHARMTQWAALSPQQRASARINFAENRQLTDGLTPEQRKVQWQAYQQLSPDEKRKLASRASQTTVIGAAPAAKPQPVLKKEPMPEFGTGQSLAKARANANAMSSPGKRISVAPHVAAQGAVLPGNLQAEKTAKP